MSCSSPAETSPPGKPHFREGAKSSYVTGLTAILTLVAQACVTGTITNSATVTAATADPSPDDNIASAVTQQFSF